jgi:hypothetical protein
MTAYFAVSGRFNFRLGECQVKPLKHYMLIEVQWL